VMAPLPSFPRSLSGMTILTARLSAEIGYLGEGYAETM
jgi:hypothetical protein